MKTKMIEFLHLAGGRFSAALVLLAGISSASATTYYVDVNGTNAAPPFASLATAATNIQDAVDVAEAGDEIVVTNGVYPGGVVVSSALALRSVSGPQFTFIDGGGSVQCIYLTDGASLRGFTVTNGAGSLAQQGSGVSCSSTNVFLTNCVIVGNAAYGVGGVFGGTLYNCILSNNTAWTTAGGASGSVLYNCTLTGNSAGYNGAGGGADTCALYNCTLSSNSAAYGGGASQSTLFNCVVTGNSAGQAGGGAWSSSLYNCTVTDNSAGWSSYGGGVNFCTLYNCIVCSNAAWSGENYDGSSLNYCCTTPLPSDGVGNITNAPLFVDSTNGNLRLQPNSPCINAGTNYYAPGPTDLDGRSRIIGGTVDMGAYEWMSSGPLLGISHSTQGIVLSWPKEDPDWRLETAGVLAAGTNPWTLVPTPYETNGANLQFTEPAPHGRQFYRLRKP
jgi:hypothetical protein